MLPGIFGLYGNWYTDTLKDAVAMIEKLQSETDLATEKYNSAVRAAKAKAVKRQKGQDIMEGS